MYFLWKRNSYGIIRISCDGLYDFADNIIKSRIKLYSITLSQSDINKNNDADMIIVLSEENIIPESKNNIEEHFISVLEPMGIKASIIWAEPEKNILSSFLHSPILWAGAASSISVLVTAGAEGFFWVAFWGIAAGFASYGLKIIMRYFRRI